MDVDGITASVTSVRDDMTTLESQLSVQNDEIGLMVKRTEVDAVVVSRFTVLADGIKSEVTQQVTNETGAIESRFNSQITQLSNEISSIVTETIHSQEQKLSL